MMIGMGLFWLAIILGVVWLVRDSRERQQEASSENALTILDRHFAEGAVSVDEYKQRRDVLTGAAAPSAAGHFSEPSTVGRAEQSLPMPRVGYPLAPPDERHVAQ